MLDGIFSFLEISDSAFGNSGLAREQLSGKLFCFCPDLIEIFRVNYSLVLAECFIGRVPPASAIMDRSGPLAQRVDASLPM